MACLFFTHRLNSPVIHQGSKLSMPNSMSSHNDTTVRVAKWVYSIVAVHGLNGTAKKTWTDKNSGKFWLEDFLPEALPQSRIMTFGYDSGLAFSRSKAGVENFARDLLNRLRLVRGSHQVRS
jgi:hypothetical protein